MIEVIGSLFVGSDADVIQARERGFAIVHCAKDPWHRQAVGYTTRAAPEGPRRLIFQDGDELYLNMVDAPDPAYLPRLLFDEADRFIGQSLSRGKSVLVHCNKGQSRGPGVAMWFMRRRLPEDFPDAVVAFTKLYPPFQPASGVFGRLASDWGADEGGSPSVHASAEKSTQ